MTAAQRLTCTGSVVLGTVAALITNIALVADGGKIDGSGFTHLPSDLAKKLAPPAEGGIATDPPCGEFTLSQNVDSTTIVPGNTIECVQQTPLTSFANGIARSFAATVGGAIDCVTFGIETNAGGAWPVDVNIYLGDIAGPFEGLQLVGSTTVIIADGDGPALHTAKFLTPVNVATGTTFVVEIFFKSRALDQGGDGGYLFIGSNSAGETAPTYVRSVDCGLVDFLPYAAIGYPDVHAIIVPSIGLPVVNFCGSPAAGSCFTVHPTPFCGVGGCCQAVCSVDAHCCAVAWDAACVSAAFAFCSPVEQCAAKTFWCEGGCRDQFGTSNSESSSPSAALLATVPQCTAPYDMTNADQCWGETLHCWPSCAQDGGPGDCGTIVGAFVEIRLRGLCAFEANDAIYFFNGGTQVWGAPIATLAGGSWSCGQTTTLVLDLANLPVAGPGTNIIGSLYDGELSVVVQDDTAVDYVSITVLHCPCTDNGIRYVFERDASDGFTSPTPTTPSAALLALVNCGSGSLTQYDVSPVDQCFVETIDNLPSCINNAIITIDVKPGPSSLWTTDGLAFEVVATPCGGPKFAWSMSFAQLNAMGAFSPPLATNQISSITLDLSNLPPDAQGDRSVLPFMLDGSLDIYIQDDTGVDTIFLGVDSCEPCGAVGAPEGACCWQAEGPPGSMNFICTPETQQSCEQLPFSTWYGPNTNCDVIPCKKPCTTPPFGMVGWWPFDELAGPVADDLTILGNNGAYKPNVVNGPTPGPGYVDGSLTFDGVNDRIEVPHSGSLEFACGAFSVDAWIKRQIDLPGVLVQKISAFPLGWSFSIEGDGTLRLDTDSQCVRCIAFSTSTVPFNSWTHVAVTVSGCDCSDQNCLNHGGRTGTFYINGAAAGSFGSSCCDLTSGAPLAIGGPAAGSLFGAFFGGMMDEVEVFSRELDPFEVLDLYNAGTSGKCKDTCHASWDRLFCDPSLPSIGDFTICNFSGAAYNYTYTLTPKTYLAGCAAAIALSPSAGVVSVGPNSCVTIPVSATLIGPANPGDLGCFTVTIVNTTTGQACSAMGQTPVGNGELWITPCDPVVQFPLGMQKLVGFDITNIGSPLPVVEFKIDVFPSDMMSTEKVVSLNGLPPGTRYIGNLFVPPGQTKQATVEARFTQPDSFQFHDVILSVDIDGDGAPEQVSSIGIINVGVPSCPADLNGDGVVDGADLGIMLGAWGTPGADLNGDGTTDGADLGIMLGAWGAC